MRRKDREMDKEFAIKLLKECEYATLATISEQLTPYCVPISFVLEGNYIYFHCALKGEKVDNIAKNPNVCLSCVGATKLLPSEFSTQYESVIVKGICTQIQENEKKLFALAILCEKYSLDYMYSFDDEIEKSFHVTGVYKIEIVEITAKARKN